MTVVAYPAYRRITGFTGPDPRGSWRNIKAKCCTHCSIFMGRKKIPNGSTYESPSDIVEAKIKPWGGVIGNKFYRVATAKTKAISLKLHT